MKFFEGYNWCGTSFLNNHEFNIPEERFSEDHVLAEIKRIFEYANSNGHKLRITVTYEDTSGQYWEAVNFKEEVK